MRRHPQLSLGQPDSNSIARRRGFNRANVNVLTFSKTVVDENGLTAVKIFNVDETGFSLYKNVERKYKQRKKNLKLVLGLPEKE